MQVVQDKSYCAKRSVLALGMFDGVHIGHRVLIQRGAALARQKGVPLIVCTFATHPLQLVAPEKCPPLLCTFEQRNGLMEALGVDVLCAMPFTPEVMNLPAADYVGGLVRRFHPTDVVCGYNHTFGREGKGTPALLSALGEALGFVTSVVPRITLEGADVSSTAIRGLLADGDADLAARMLGRPYSLDATVHADGHTLTLDMQGRQRLADGAYRVRCSDANHAYPTVADLRGDEVRLSLPDACRLEGGVTLEWLCGASLSF